MLTEEEFLFFYKTNFKPMCGYAYSFIKNKLISEDVVQDAFVGLWKYREKYYSYTAKAFLLRAVKNKSLNEIRHEKVKKEKQKEIIYTINGEVEDREVERQAIKFELLSLCYRAIETLPPGQKRIMQTWLKSDKSKNMDIAMKLGLSFCTIKEHKQLAYKRIKKFVEDQTIIIDDRISINPIEPIYAYCDTTKSKRREIKEPVVYKTAHGGYQAIGHDGRGAKLSKLLSAQQARAALKSGIAKQGW